MGSPLSSDVLSAPLALADCVRGRSAQRASAPAKQFLHRTSFARAPRRVRYRGARMRAQVSATAYRRAFMVNLPSRPGCAAQCAAFPVCGRSLGGEGGVAAKRLVGWRRAPWMCVARAGTQGPRGHSTRSLLTPRTGERSPRDRVLMPMSAGPGEDALSAIAGMNPMNMRERARLARWLFRHERNALARRVLWGRERKLSYEGAQEERPLHGGPASRWPRRVRRVARGCL